MGLLTSRFQAAPNRADYGNLRKFGASFSPRYRVCTKAIIIPKGRYVNEELKKVMFVSVQKAHFPVPGCKLPGFMH